MKTIKEINFESGKKITITKGFWDYIWRCVTISLWDTDGNLLDKFQANSINAICVNTIQFSTNRYTYLMSEYGCVRVVRTQQSSNYPSREYYICQMLKTKNLGVIIKEFAPEVRMFISVPFELGNLCQTIGGVANRMLMINDGDNDEGFLLVGLDNGEVLYENIYPYNRSGGLIPEIVDKNLLPVYKYVEGTKKVGVISLDGKIIIPFMYEDILSYFVNGKALFHCFYKKDLNGKSLLCNKDGDIIISEGNHNSFMSDDKTKVTVETTEVVEGCEAWGMLNFKTRSKMFTKIHTLEIW